MKHLYFIVGVCFGLGFIMFVIGWLLGGQLAGLIAGLVIFGISLGLTARAYWQGSRTLKKLEHQYAAETVVYGDVAGLMDGRRELTGALVVTQKRVVFETISGKHAPQRLDFPLEGIALAKNVRDIFRLAAHGREYRFKVFRCNALVAAIHAGIDAIGDNSRVDFEMAIH